jgi:chemotaxis protein methyltransferase CheR
VAERCAAEVELAGISDLARISDREFRDLRALILAKTGINLTEAKRQLLCARLGRRLRALGLATFGEYYALLCAPDATAECVEMINCITTNKTDFFREPHHFDVLRELVLEPARERARRGGARRLAIWSCCCSSGEEPYTIAMAVTDALGGEPGWDVRILASDIDTAMLAQAERGIYEEARLQPIGRERWGRYFLRGTGPSQGWYQVRPELRRLVTFRRINVAESLPVQGRFDAIFCRNALIYFTPELQRRVVEGFVRLLGPDDLLFVGHSESLYWARGILEPVRNTVYRRPRVAEPACT